MTPHEIRHLGFQPHRILIVDDTPANLDLLTQTLEPRGYRILVAPDSATALLVAALLMVGTIAGILMALFLNNAGGAWDNAKKFVEMGNYGGKKSEAHKAAVVGDTVGDPFKDTAGPSIHVLIKLLATLTLVLAPMFVGSH